MLVLGLKENRVYNIVGMVAVLLIFTPMVQARPPKNALKPRKVKRILKKVERLDDLHYIPLHRDYDMNNVARSSNNESNLVYYVRYGVSRLRSS